VLGMDLRMNRFGTLGRVDVAAISSVTTEAVPFQVAPNRSASGTMHRRWDQCMDQRGSTPCPSDHGRVLLGTPKSAAAPTMPCDVWRWAVHTWTPGFLDVRP